MAGEDDLTAEATRRVGAAEKERATRGERAERRERVAMR